MDSMVQNKDVFPKFCMPLKTGIENRKMIKHDERFSSLMTNIVTPNCTPPMPEKSQGDFLEFISKNHKLQLRKCAGSTKTTVDTNLRMGFSTLKQTSDLITNEAKNFTRCHKKTIR